jgi:hypothetical protein
MDAASRPALSSSRGDRQAKGQLQLRYSVRDDATGELFLFDEAARCNFGSFVTDRSTCPCRLGASGRSKSTSSRSSRPVSLVFWSERRIKGLRAHHRRGRASDYLHRATGANGGSMTPVAAARRIAKCTQQDDENAAEQND